jgi:hypothetical protein
MFGITRLILNLSIGAKLGIASGLGVLLVATMVIVQIRSNAVMRGLDARMSGQQTIARDAVDTKASLRGMQIGVRDLRLASNAADIQKANDYIATRLKSVDHFVDEMLKLSKSAENRARIEKLKTRASDYSKGAQQISAVRAEIVAAAGATDAAARIAKLNEEALRIAREVTLPIAAEIEPLANQIADFAKHGVEEQAAQAASEMATAEWESMALGIGTILLLIATSIFSFFTIARPMRALSVSMDELAGGNFAVVLPGLGRSSARSPALSRNSRSSRSRRPARRRKPRSSRTRSRRNSARPRWSSSPIPSRPPSARSSRPCHPLQPNSKRPPAR